MWAADGVCQIPYLGSVFIVVIVKLMSPILRSPKLTTPKLRRLRHSTLNSKSQTFPTFSASPPHPQTANPTPYKVMHGHSSLPTRHRAGDNSYMVSFFKPAQLQNVDTCGCMVYVSIARVCVCVCLCVIDCVCVCVYACVLMHVRIHVSA